MPRLIRCFLLPLVLASTLVPAAAAQAPQKSCPAPPAILAPTQPNIFSEQQEQWLGDATADQIERSYKIVKDPAENEYLTRITNRLLAALPPTKLQFHVVLVDMPVVNAFSIAGGHVYVSRKLVANARNEDEVASVIGHEMGHILSHQFGIETTADLKRLLNITSVGDKADVYAKFQLLIDARMKDKHPTRTGNSDEGQDQADTVSAYAIAAAGYRPQAFSEFWDRMFFVDGKVGGPLSDFFGVTKPQEKRLRAILKLVNSLPPGCGASEPSNSPEFQKWQTLVTANQPTVQEPNVKPAAEVALNPPLRMQLEGLRFSRDGKYLLAQDESSIFVLSRDPYKPLFRFDAEGAQRAEFSPDSQHIVFQTPGLHTEEWSIPDQKLVASHELNTKQPCAQSEISPDGRTIFCVSFASADPGLEVIGTTGKVTFSAGPTVTIDLNLLDAATGSVLSEKKGFFESPYAFFIEWVAARALGERFDLIPFSVSADGNFMLIGPSTDKLAFDLRSRTPVPIGRDLKNDVNGPYAFLGNDKVVGVSKHGVARVGAANSDVSGSGVFAFPDRKRIEAVPFGLTDLSSVSSGNFVVSHNIEGYAVGLVDVSAAKFVVASKAPSIDVWDNSLLNENADGSVVLHKLGDKTVPDQTATLPISPLGPVITSISDDGSLLAISTRTRGGVWNLATGERVLLARPFNAAVFYPDNSVYIEFAKQDKEERAIVHFTFSPFAATPVTYKEEKTAALTHSGLQEWKRSEDKKSVELIARDPRDNSVLWRRTYATAQFAHTSSTIVPGQIIAAFTLKSDFAKSRLSDSPALANEAAAIQNRDKGGLVQVIDSSTGNVLHEIVLEIPLDYEGLQGIHVFGDSLYLTGRANRTIVYSLATGKSGRQFFGTLVAADPSSKRICLMNRRDEAMVYNAQGQQLADYEMGSPIRFATFQGAGNRLILLTANQKVRTMAITDTPAP